jgi:hypothetical protein
LDSAGFRSACRLLIQFPESHLNDTIELGQVIAERVLQSDTGEVTVRIGIPKEHDQDFYITPYLIVGVGNEKNRYAGGMDAVQSLQLAFEMIGNDLQQRFPSANIVWRGAKDHGFRATIRRPQPDAPPD